MRWLARAAHMRPDGQHDALGVLREELKRQSLRVSRLHAKLFYQPLLESVEGQPSNSRRACRRRRPNVSSPHWDTRVRRAR